MTEPPRISVIIPAYNVDAFLAATLDSLLAQTETSWTCVVVDDGSTDRTLSIAEDYASRDPRITACAQSNSGASAARNHGFACSDPRAEYVSFMDADDVWRPHALATLRSRIEGSPTAVGAHGLAETVDAEGRPLDPGWYSARGRNRMARTGRRMQTLPLDAPTGFSTLINGNVLFPPGLLLARRSAYATVGAFDTRLVVAEDWDMLIRLSRLGDLEMVDDVLLLYRRHDNNLGANGMAPSQAWTVKCKQFHSENNTAAQRVDARAGWRATQLWRAGACGREARRALRTGHIIRSLRVLAVLPVLLARYVRGYPRPSTTWSEMSWPTAADC